MLVVVEGEGRARVGERDFALAPRDLLVVPSWEALALQAESELVLFGYSDAAAQQKLGLWREARL